MFAWLWLVFAALVVLGQKDLSSIPLYGGGRDFRVAVISQTLSIVCSNGVTVTCQAVEIEAQNQTLLGLPHEVASYQDFLEVEMVASPNGEYVLVCYSTYSFGTKCTTVNVDVNFGLLQTQQQVFVCAVGEVCQELALTAMPNDPSNTTFALCFSGPVDSYCNKLVVTRELNVQVSIQVFNLMTAVDEVWSSTSVVIASKGELMHCAVLLGTITQTARCRLINPTTLQFIPQKQFIDNLHGVTIISGAYLGELQGIEFSIVCYLQQRNLICLVVFVNQQNIIKSTSATFPAEYTGLSGLRVQSITDFNQGDQVLSCMVCLSSMEDNTELVCTMATIIGRSGILELDPYEMVVNGEGFYFQNVPQALQATDAVGGYLESSQRIGKQTSGISPSEDDDEKVAYIADVTVLPDFYATFNRTDNRSSIASVGCVNCQPGGNVLLVGTSVFFSTSTNKCQSRYDCVAAGTTKTQCTLANTQGALCEWTDSCQPTYEWDAASMCNSITVQARCGAQGLGCGWFTGKCFALPYCDFVDQTSCLRNTGCVWVGRRCGVAA
ncbi:hypothetical protein BASA81_004889 [Batrachochytrium salamandrivorans]|nr:hypothetical protein BASA81_004889 [Batrachochytrium salamandrivorans]